MCIRDRRSGDLQGKGSGRPDPAEQHQHHRQRGCCRQDRKSALTDPREHGRYFPTAAFPTGEAAVFLLEGKALLQGPQPQGVLSIRIPRKPSQAFHTRKERDRKRRRHGTERTLASWPILLG